MVDIIISPLNHSKTYVFADESIQKEISEYFSYEVQGARYMQAVKRRHWDGRIRIFHKPSQTLPTGLIPRLEWFAAKRGYSVQNKLTTTSLGWSEFDTESLIAKYPNTHSIRHYQREAITYALNNQRCALLSPTGSGKSLILYYLVRQRMEIGPVLIIVPTISLVSQMVNDFRDYGWTDVDAYVHQIIGGVEKKTKKPCIISTWQSIYKQPEEWFSRFNSIIGDEAHTFKSESLQSIMNSLPDCGFRIGVTGTLDDAKSNKMLVEAAFGPSHRVAKTVELQKSGYLAPIKVQGHFLQYSDYEKWFIREHKRGYKEEVDYFVEHSGRMDWLTDFIQQLSGNVLVLFNFVDKHGKPLFAALKEKLNNSRPIYFISGDVSAESRERVRGLLEQPEHIVLIFGDTQVRCTAAEMVPLTNGESKCAADITCDDDVADSWILNNEG
jgi:hypothetical protein